MTRTKEAASGGEAARVAPAAPEPFPAPFSLAPMLAVAGPLPDDEDGWAQAQQLDPSP